MPRNLEALSAGIHKVDDNDSSLRGVTGEIIHAAAPEDIRVAHPVNHGRSAIAPHPKPAGRQAKQQGEQGQEGQEMPSRAAVHVIHHTKIE